MAYITNGLDNDGVTTHYKFSYDEALAGPGGLEPDRTNAVIRDCEGDYNLMFGWFGGGFTVTGMSVQVTTESNGASWSGSSSSSTIQLIITSGPTPTSRVSLLNGADWQAKTFA
jgi:hypothetical protein